MSEGSPTVQDNELQIHIQTYLRLFQAILKKKSDDPNKKKVILQELHKYFVTNIKNPDESIQHIPNFAKLLSVRAEALSTYIGANFLPVHAAVVKELAQKKQQGSMPATAPGFAINTPFLGEIVERFGTLLEPPIRFERLEAGYVKLVTPSGEILPQSLKPTPTEAEAEQAEADKADGTTTESAEPDGEPEEAPLPELEAVPDTPIFGEIFERYKADLKVRKKLVPPSGLEELEHAAAEQQAVAVAAEKLTAADSGGEGAPVETSLIEEIIERFGSEMNVYEKLTPTSGLEGLEGEVEFESSEDGADGEDGGFDQGFVEEIADFSLPFSFMDFTRVNRKLQGFQKSGDRAAYEAWIKNESAPIEDVFVAFRKLTQKEKRGDEFLWADEYYNLSLKLENSSPAQVEELHTRVQKFYQMQAFLNQMTGGLKKQSPVVVQSVRKIWPQILLLLSEEHELGAMMSRFQVVLLQIPQQEIKDIILSLFEPLFRKVDALFSH